MNGRLELLHTRHWGEEDIFAHYGYTFEMLNLRGLQDQHDGKQNRLTLEGWIWGTGWLSPRLVAASLALQESVVRELALGGAFRVVQAGDQFLLHRNELNRWVQEVTAFGGVWANDIRRATQVHKALVALGVDPVPLLDVSGQDLLAFCYCAFTRTPISPSRAEYLRTPAGKRSFDPNLNRIGWVALLENPELEACVMGTLANFKRFKEALSFF